MTALADGNITVSNHVEFGNQSFLSVERDEVEYSVIASSDGNTTKASAVVAAEIAVTAAVSDPAGRSVDRSELPGAIADLATLGSVVDASPGSIAVFSATEPAELFEAALAVLSGGVVQVDRQPDLGLWAAVLQRDAIRLLLVVERTESGAQLRCAVVPG